MMSLINSKLNRSSAWLIKACRTDSEFIRNMLSLICFKLLRRRENTKGRCLGSPIPSKGGLANLKGQRGLVSRLAKIYSSKRVAIICSQFSRGTYLGDKVRFYLRYSGSSENNIIKSVYLIKIIG